MKTRRRVPKRVKQPKGKTKKNKGTRKRMFGG